MMQAEIISRKEAIAFLEKPRPVWVDILGKLAKVKLVRGRGAGGAVDVINYGARNGHGKLVCVMRVGMPPYGGAPAKAAVGKELAPKCLYLMRLSAIGISANELRAFVASAIGRIPTDTQARFQYLLSLDNPNDILIEGAQGLLAHNRAVTGQVYIDAGALRAGITGSRNQATRYVTPDGSVKSIYRNGQNLTARARADGLRVIREGAKQRFLWVLAAPDSNEYARLKAVLPAWVVNHSQAAWTQPRLISKLFIEPFQSRLQQLKMFMTTLPAQTSRITQEPAHV